VPRRAADEEHVALSAFASFCRGVERGQFPRLADRKDLWGTLVVITARKALDLAAAQRRLKRGAGKVRGDSALQPAKDGEGRRGIEEVIGRSRRRSSPRRWPRNTGGCSTRWAKGCGRSRCGGWRARPPRRSW
jgi:hypothetical protein